jgi:hypothetical protein
MRATILASAWADLHAFDKSLTPLTVGFRLYVRNRFGPSAEILAALGIKPPATAKLTLETKIAAVGKRAPRAQGDRRKANGKKQRSKGRPQTGREVAKTFAARNRRPSAALTGRSADTTVF